MKKEDPDRHIGSSFSDFLSEQGIRNEVETSAIKRVLAWQFEEAMKKQEKSKRVLARQLKTSRSQVDRLLDPNNTGVSIETVARAADALGKELVFELRDRPVKARIPRRKAS